MARARNIKPGFFKNEELAELGPLAMLLFEGLWCLADREGRLEDRPKRIKAETFPYFDADVDALLSALERSNFIARYCVNGAAYIQVLNFTKHQRPHSNEVASVIPEDTGLPIKDDGLSTKVDSTVDQGEQRFVLIPDTGYLIPDTGLLERAQERDDGADAPPKPKVKRATAITDDWEPNGESVKWAGESLALTFAQQDAETAKFRDHFKATGKPMKDWDAAWKNWMRRSREFAPRGSPTSNGKVRSFVEIAEDNARERARNVDGAGAHPRSLLANAQERGERSRTDAADLGGDAGRRAIDALHRKGP